jgi:hypothetical protein
MLTFWHNMDELTSSPKRKRVTRTPDEMRECILYFRVTRRELDEIYRFSRARKATMSYMIREALREKYPDIFADINRHIRKPRPAKSAETPTQMLHSLANGSVTIVDSGSEE